MREGSSKLTLREQLDNYFVGMNPTDMIRALPASGKNGSREERREETMKKSNFVVSCVCFSFLLAACSKDKPEPATPARAEAEAAPPAPAATAPRPDPVTDSAVPATREEWSALQIRVWTDDDGLRDIAPGAIVALPAGTRMRLHLYPQPENASNLTFNGPLRLANQGGFTVLELAPDTRPGRYEIRVRSGAGELPLTLEVRE